MKAPWFALAIVGSSAGAARADYDVEWRDGCPGGNLARTPDVQHRWADTLERYDGTRPELIGALPQPDSALAGNQIGVDSRIAHFASPGAGGNSASVYGGVLRAHGNAPLSHWSNVRWSAGLAAMLSAHRLEDGHTSIDRLGNLVLEPELRAHWVATGTNVVDSLGDVDHQAAGLRNSVAIQAIISAPLDQAMPARSERLGLWRRDAFEGYLVSPRGTLGGALEIRSEGVGCYAPFVHLRLSLTFTDVPIAPAQPAPVQPAPAQPAMERMVMVAPQTLSFGFALSSRASMLLQYGLLVYLTRDGQAAEGSLIGATAIHRFRVGGERVFDSVTMAVHFDYFLGSALYDGTIVGVSLAWRLGEWQ
jgi:hypothetical protein